MRPAPESGAAARRPAMGDVAGAMRENFRTVECGFEMGTLQEAPETYRLPPILDLKAAAPLRAQLLELRGRPIVLDGEDVQRLGGLCLQVLLSARDSWVHDGMPFSLNPASDALQQSFALFGVEADEFTHQENDQ